MNKFEIATISLFALLMTGLIGYGIGMERQRAFDGEHIPLVAQDGVKMFLNGLARDNCENPLQGCQLTITVRERPFVSAYTRPQNH